MKATKLHTLIEGDKVAQTPRMHLGCSEIGHDCTRYLWYKFRWVFFPDFEPRMLRLFDRGHRAEKIIFAALLESFGMTVILEDIITGEQFMISDFEGHFGGSLDGIVLGVPDMPGVWMLLEFKTYNLKWFNDLLKKGSIRNANRKHFAQMQGYMHGKGLKFALYCAVCKNDDRLYFEIVAYDEHYARNGMLKADVAITSPTPPPRIAHDANNEKCRYCDARMVCQFNYTPHRNCRTCQHILRREKGTWQCGLHGHMLDKQSIVNNCESYELSASLLIDTKQTN